MTTPTPSDLDRQAAEWAKSKCMEISTPTPETDAEETQQRAEYESLREVDWPSFPADFDFARKLECERDELKQLLATANDSFAKQLHHLNIVCNAQVVELALDRDAWKAKAERTCKWTAREWSEFCKTECGESFPIPRQDKYKCCPNCGGRIVKEEK